MSSDQEQKLCRERERAVSCAAAVERDTWLSSFCLLVITVTDQIAYFDARLYFIKFTDIASRLIMDTLNQTPQKSETHDSKLYLMCNNYLVIRNIDMLQVPQN